MSKPLPVAVIHPGTQHSWQTARALQDLGQLEFFVTSLYNDPARFPYSLARMPGPLGRKLQREFGRFSVPFLDPKHVRARGLWEWAERLAARAGFRALASELDLAGNQRFVRQVARDIASPERFALWCYNNSAREIFAAGKRHDRLCILDRTIGDWRHYDREMQALADRYGAWFGGTPKPTDPRVIAREDEEYALADHILVGCEFARQSVIQEATDKTVANRTQVLHYGYDPRFDAVEADPGHRNGPVRFLFAGLGIPRKGIQHALEAIMRFPASEATLTLLGSIGVPDAAFAPYRDRVTHIPTTPRSEVPQIMARHDVLLFPTYFEGAGIVLYEALAAGMALIQSDRAALAVTPETGILLDRPGTEELAAAMEVAVRDRTRLAAWRAAAPAAARAYRFECYRDRIAAMLARADR